MGEDNWYFTDKYLPEVGKQVEAKVKWPNGKETLTKATLYKSIDSMIYSFVCTSNVLSPMDGILNVICWRDM